MLAEALRQQGKLDEAREQYRAFLRHQPKSVSSDYTDDARNAIAKINERLGKN